MRSEPILRLEGVSKVFGEFTALDQIDLDIQEGEFLTIVGPSGSGKTTLIRILVGIEELSEGKIWLRDTRIEKLPANLRPTCMVFQSLALFPHKSVGENIEFPLKLRGKILSTGRLELTNYSTFCICPKVFTTSVFTNARVVSASVWPLPGH